MREWIESDKQLPPPMRRVLCWWTWPGAGSRPCGHGVGYHTGDYIGWRSGDGDDSWAVSYWMPLPNGPFLHNAGGMARELAALEPESTTDLNG